jgi:type I restriction enzyme R subunit
MRDGSKSGQKEDGLRPSVASPNFAYLTYHDPRLSEVATRAERVVGVDPVAALMHLRQFGELLAKNVAARLGVYDGGEQQQVDRLRELNRFGLAANVLDMLHSVRLAGNRAAHEGRGTQQEAFTQLKLAFQLAIWFQRSFGNDRRFDPGPFVPPPDLHADALQLRAELEALAQEAEKHREEVAAARRAHEEQLARALGAEQAAQKAREEASSGRRWRQKPRRSARAINRRALELNKRSWSCSKSTRRRSHKSRRPRRLHPSSPRNGHSSKRARPPRAWSSTRRARASSSISSCAR